MDLTTFQPCPTKAQQVIVLFCLAWPFLAMASIPRRGRSSAPLSAVIVALAVVVCGLWIDLADVVMGMALSGGGPGSASYALHWTFGAASIAIWPVAWIVVLTLAIRHRPALDPFVIALAAILGVHLVAAILFVQVLVPSASLVLFARAAAAAAVASAMTAALRLFFVTARA